MRANVLTNNFVILFLPQSFFSFPFTCLFFFFLLLFLFLFFSFPFFPSIVLYYNNCRFPLPFILFISFLPSYALNPRPLLNSLAVIQFPPIPPSCFIINLAKHRRREKRVFVCLFTVVLDLWKLKKKKNF